MKGMGTEYHVIPRPFRAVGISWYRLAPFIVVRISEYPYRGRLPRRALPSFDSLRAAYGGCSHARACGRSRNDTLFGERAFAR